MEYAAAVERHFREPSNVGPLAEACACRGEAGSPARGAWIVIEARIDGGMVRGIAFQAFGCPHVIAACSRATEILGDGPVTRLAHFDPGVLIADLAIPPEKLGSLLILQDALRNCFADWDTTQPAGPP